MPVEALLEQALTEGMFLDAGEQSANAGAAVPDARLSALLQQWSTEGMDVDVTLVEQVQASGLQPARPAANVLYFCDQLFGQLQAHADIAAPLLRSFMALRPAVARAMLQSPAILLGENSKLTAFLDVLLGASFLWYEGLGRQGDKYRAGIEACLQQLRMADLATAPLGEWLDSFTQQQARDMQRAELLAVRICQSERGALAARAAGQAVRRQVNVLLQAGPMPEIVETLLKGPLRNLLQMIFLKEGMAGDAWRRAVHLADLLLQSLRLPGSEEEKQRQYQLIPRMSSLLAEQLGQVATTAELEDWLRQVEALHMRVLMGQTVDTVTPQPLSALADEETLDSAVTVSDALLAEVDRIGEGQWLIYRGSEESGDGIRCRLALKMPDVGQMLFVNLLGAKCLEKSLEEFAYLLAARHIRLLDAQAVFSLMVRDTADAVVRLHEAGARLRDDARQRQQQLQAARLRQQQAVQAAAAVEAERLAREKAELQAREVAEAHAQALAQTKQLQADAWQDATVAVDHLGIGAWLDLEHQGVMQKAKLAALLRGGDRLVLVGRDGRKLAELGRDELVGLIIAGKAAIIEKGDQFERSLARVIQTLRKD